MEGVASAFAVVSLALQLVQSVETVRTFIRDVKSASKELARLAELLTRLAALLQDVRDVMERQTSLQHFPRPSNTIFACLKSCEASLGLLEEVIKQHGRAEGNADSAVKRFRDDIRLGFKMKDIGTFETRIQREIEELHAALGVNTTSIETTVFPVVISKRDLAMENQKTIIAATNLILAKQQEMHSWITTKVANRHEVSLSSAPTSIVHTITRQEWIRSRLSWLGVRQRRTTRYLSIPTSRQKSSGHTPNNIIEDRHDVILSWPFFAYGFHVDWQWSYGSILPSLRVYPIIKDFRPYEYMMQKSLIAEWQQMFETGALSPFVRTPYGSTLLHQAVMFRRLDLCHLLFLYGVRLELDVHDESPLNAFLYDLTWKRSHRVCGPPMDDIDTLRALLEFDQIDEFSPSHEEGWDVSQMMTTRVVDDLDLTKWLWFNAASAFHGRDLLDVHVHIIQALMNRCRWDRHGYSSVSSYKAIVPCLLAILNEEMKDLYLEGAFTLLPLLSNVSCSVDSWCSGRAFLDVLATLGVDAKFCIRMEIEREHSMWRDEELNRRLKLEERDGVVQHLRWEWAFESHAPGFQVVAEFNGLSGDTPPMDLWNLSWPFRQPHSSDYFEDFGETKAKRIARLDRRMARHDIKERARTGQKRPRSKMPGAWI